MFLEASAKTGECVEEAFLKCSKSILAKIETGELDPERIGSGTSYILHFFSNGERGRRIPVFVFVQCTLELLVV
jgi:hypothetical protein